MQTLGISSQEQLLLALYNNDLLTLHFPFNVLYQNPFLNSMLELLNDQSVVRITREDKSGICYTMTRLGAEMMKELGYN